MGRRLGQHFLTDPAILDRIVDALEPNPQDLVLEIGPGTGTLTRRLAPRVGWVVAVEKDREMVGREKGKGVRGKVEGARGEKEGLFSNISVIEADALALDWHQTLSNVPYPLPLTPSRFKTTGNIPYYITTPLIDKALTPPLPSCIVFLLQREVADRLVAEPGSKTYGALTVGVQAAASVEKLFSVRRGSFRPAPKVDSAVVRIAPRPAPLVTEQERRPFRECVQALFGRRRKQIGNIVRATSLLEPDAVGAALVALDIDPTSRPEVLSVETLIALFRRVYAGEERP